MNIYISLLFLFEFLLILLYYILFPSTERGKKKYLLAAFSILLFFHIFKEPYTMPDLPGYVEGFEEVASNNWRYIYEGNVSSIKAEITWFYFCKILSLFSSHYIILFIVVSLITLGGYYKTVKYYSPYYWISIVLILVGPYEQSIYVLRQHMAMGVILFSYPYILKKDSKSYLLTIFAAFLFHYTAIIFLPVYYIYNTKVNFKWVCLGLIIGAFMIVGVILRLLSDLFVFLDTTHYDSYLTSDEGANWKMGGLMLALFLFRIWVMRKKAMQYGIDRLLTIVVFMASLIGIFGTGLVFTSRLNMYFTASVFLVIPNTAMNINYKPLKHIYIIITLFFYVVMWLIGNHEFTEGYRLSLL